jgi:hypothetical protein
MDSAPNNRCKYTSQKREGSRETEMCNQATSYGNDYCSIHEKRIQTFNHVRSIMNTIAVDADVPICRNSK